LQAPAEGLSVNGNNAKTDDFALGDAVDLHVLCSADRAILLLASQSIETVSSDPLRILSVDSAKRVEKPWGHEIWLTGDPSKVFAFKKILLKASNKTSLQYHKFKRETNFILEGVADFHFNPDSKIAAENFEAHSVSKARLQGPCVVDVYPGLVHRLEAVEDLLLYEVSTPELDDVIRISDDAGRASGRVTSEHIRNN
jgi:mannose-6-phosphate isomerase-like protein (cupin superfamily)